MQVIRVAKLPSEVNWPPRGAAVVIDVLRATTVITQAIQNGAAAVVICGEIDEAFRLAQSTPRPLLCGERACRPIDGFDLGNSPAEYTPHRVGGKQLVMTTTNGTRAAIAAVRFNTIYAASFNNLSAVVDALERESEITVLCAGTDGQVTDEDLLLAGAIVHRLRGEGLEASASDAVQLWEAHLASEQPLSLRLSETLGGKNLVAAGYYDDIALCAQIDTTTALPRVTATNPIRFH
jgi:2-phosphosulfolactate phosphatase